jgi:hypothetical protein
MTVSVTLTFNTLAEAIAELGAIVIQQAGERPAPAPKVEAKPDPKPQAEKTATQAPAAAPKPAATPPSAATAPTAAPSVDYATLSSAVLKLMKLDPTAPAPIVKSLGFDTFKLMKEAENASELFAKALPLVQAKIAELEAV